MFWVKRWLRYWVDFKDSYGIKRVIEEYEHKAYKTNQSNFQNSIRLIQLTISSQENNASDKRNKAVDTTHNDGKLSELNAHS